MMLLIGSLLTLYCLTAYNFVTDVVVFLEYYCAIASTASATGKP